MKFVIGIIGLPNAGKSTFFQTLTKIKVNIQNYPFTTISPNVGVVAAPDERLNKIAKIFHSQKILPCPLEFMDIAGLVKGAHQGQGLGNRFLAQIREADALIHILRVFRAPSIPHLEGEISPIRDFEIVQNELEMKDSESKEKNNFLVKKPQIILLNGKKEEIAEDVFNFFAQKKLPCLTANLAAVSSEEIIKPIFEAFLKLLDLIVFFTANENEARSWLVKKGISVRETAGLVHSDFQNKFIRAEVIRWDELLAVGGWLAARSKGLLRLEGKEYPIREGEVVLFKI